MRRKRQPPLEIARYHVSHNVDQQEKFEVRVTEEKGRGVFTKVNVSSGDFLVHYAGELISSAEGEERELNSKSVYRYFFGWKGSSFCIDATPEPPVHSDTAKLGRLVNHGEPSEINAKVKVVEVEDQPALCLFAIKDIGAGQELLYNYGVKNLPWKQESDISENPPAESSIPSSQNPGDVCAEISETESLPAVTGTASEPFLNEQRWAGEVDKILTNEGLQKKCIGRILFSKECKIADGSNGAQIYVGVVDGKVPVAVKRITKGMDSMDVEVNNLFPNSLDGSHILSNIATEEDEDFVYVATQLCECNLEELIDMKDFPLRDILSFKGRVKMCYQLMLAVKHLHQLNILHRDLKPRNVLIDQNGNLLLGDFGISRQMTTGTTLLTKALGTLCWTNRDNCGASARYKKSSDIQMLGCLMYYILSDGHIPHESTSPYTNDPEGVMVNMRNGHYSLQHLGAYTNFQHILNKMLTSNEKHRLSIEECITYFKENQKSLENGVQLAEVSSAKHQTISFVTSGMRASEKSTVQKLADLHGCLYTKTFEPGTTHVIIKADENLSCPRTLKYLQGISSKRWVVSYTWVVSSLEAGRLCPEEKYEIKGDETVGLHNGPMLSRTTESHLLQEYCIQLIGESSVITEDEASSLVTANGATILSGMTLNSSKAVIIALNEQDTEGNISGSSELSIKDTTIPVVNLDWLLDSIAYQIVQPIKKYKHALFYHNDGTRRSLQDKNEGSDLNSHGDSNVTEELGTIGIQNSTGDTKKQKEKAATGEALTKEKNAEFNTEDCNMDDEWMPKCKENLNRLKTSDTDKLHINCEGETATEVHDNHTEKRNAAVTGQGDDDDNDDDDHHHHTHPSEESMYLPGTSGSDICVEDNTNASEESSKRRQANHTSEEQNVELFNQEGGDGNHELIPSRESLDEPRLGDISTIAGDSTNTREKTTETRGVKDTSEERNAIFFTQQNDNEDHDWTPFGESQGELGTSGSDTNSWDHRQVRRKTTRTTSIKHTRKETNAALFSQQDDGGDSDWTPSRENLDEHETSDSDASVQKFPQVEKKTSEKRYSNYSYTRTASACKKTGENEDGDKTPQDSEGQEELEAVDSDTNVKSSPKLKVKTSTKRHGKRIHDKVHVCFYCESKQTHIGRHLCLVHPTEVEVAAILGHNKGSKIRKRLFKLLVNKGDRAHNCCVLERGKGVLIACRQPTKEKSPHDYLFCGDCSGLFMRKELWRHKRVCYFKTKPSSGKSHRVQSAARFLMPVPKHVSRNFWQVLSDMNQDEVATVVKRDPLILKYGAQLFKKHGKVVTKQSKRVIHDASNGDYIRQKMRESGRLLLEGKKLGISCMNDFVVPANFEVVVQAVKNLAGFDEDSLTFKTPSLVLKCGYNLYAMSNIAVCDAAMISDTKKVQLIEQFQKIYKTMWHAELSSMALCNLQESKWNEDAALPSAKDVQTLNTFLCNKIEHAQSALVKEVILQNWINLAQVTLCYLIVFNRRRVGEVSKVLLEVYKKAISNRPDVNEDIAASLSSAEEKLASHFTRVVIRGKRGRRVPLLLSPLMVKVMDLLTKTREDLNIENPYFFANPNATSRLYFRGSDCLRRFADECGASIPRTLKSTLLRKHLATTCQILNLRSTELESLANFMGHSIRVHENFYRMQEGLTQAAKVSKVLLAMESGNLGNYKGKTLDEIDPTPDATHILADESESDCESTTEDELEIQPVPVAKRKAAGKRKVASKKKKIWTKEELAAIQRHFMDHIRKNIAVKKHEAIKCLSKEPSLSSRDWKAVKFSVKNQASKYKKKFCH